jgi:hypothetical protein
MASLGADFRTDLAALIFTATPIANIADNAANSPITSIEVALHTASPSSGNQTTSETGYTSYARVPVSRSVSGYGNSSGVIDNDAAITFATCTGGSSTISHVSLGTAHTGTGKVFLSGALTANVSVSSGLAPSFAIGALVVTLS